MYGNWFGVSRNGPLPHQSPRRQSPRGQSQRRKSLSRPSGGAGAPRIDAGVVTRLRAFTGLGVERGTAALAGGGHGS